ncbi:AraC family transcriptional regulator [Krasilnikovia sp. MM14-A1259]|uniref:AraC family transcriptional regulator n=1 Tax=Krasilnikovia sp. MM14-A1259 TaxID=3373539 RepID=UPI003809DE51
MLTRSVAIHHVRVALRGARRRGVDVAAMLEQAGIPPGLLELERARVSTDQFATLTKLLWDELDDELLGLARAPSKVGTFAMMCHAVVPCPDLRSALRRSTDFYRLFPHGPRMHLAESGDEASISFDDAGFDDADHFLTEAALVVWHRFAGWLIRRRISLRRVEFAYPAPPHVLEYDLLFGAPAVFGARHTAAVFDAALLDQPVLQDEAGLRTFLRRAPADVLARIDYGSTTAARVRRLLSRALPDRLPSLDDVAARLSVSPPTLRRQLAAEGTSFQQVRDQLRRDVAVAALAGGRISIERLSTQLGFSEPSAFHRAFKRWTGSTPRSYQPG